MEEWRKIPTKTCQHFVETYKKRLSAIIAAKGGHTNDHCAELNNAVPTTPMLFMKPSSAYLTESSGPILIPRGCTDLHHEVELGVVIASECRDVSVDTAMSHVGGYALALDMTARDFQEKCKSKGQPWEIAKGFDTSLPVSRFITKEELPEPHNVVLWCKVNGEDRQRGNTREMVFNIPTLLSYISGIFTLQPGDLVLTGTPAGVGPVKAGDLISCGIADLLQCQFAVAQR
ncbi:acylpyruvase FAHD1, mitochondrial-like isoform X1 [Hyalella azteca]|uniref:Oxaloacetate tautomerase FAHD1, mitochondrial n=2 Tax=Hyalella azteca TaxID=294128 RepID=A0A8B7NHJ9_HYAAZ|nr:acylpyruvase FAHD1, mitochondrial-like isoform X1 [Hyalella azteca]